MSEFREDSLAINIEQNGVGIAAGEATSDGIAAGEATSDGIVAGEATSGGKASGGKASGGKASVETMPDGKASVETMLDGTASVEATNSGTVDSGTAPEDLQHECESECCSRRKVRSEKEYKDLMNRLSRVEGQIRGIKRMLEEDAYCIDIINQVSAANCALNSFCKVILANHIKSCVAEDIKEGSDEKLDELVKTLQKLMK